MQRVNRSTAVAVLPSPPAGGAPGYFAAPDPTGGVPATVPGFEWYNLIQEELMAVIEGQGLVPSSTDHTQMRQAILKMIQTGQKAVVISGVTFAPAVTSSGMAVYWDTVNSRFDLALADGSAKQAAVGFSDIVNGAVYALGDAVLFTGLTPGHYYLSGTVAGAITATVPTTNVVSVGVAKSATEVFVDIDAAGGITQTQADARYAALAGLATQLFNVASATAASHAVNFGQIGNGKAIAKAWVNFDGTLAGTITPRASYNVSSITKNATGDYTLNFTNAMADANYAPAIVSGYSANASVMNSINRMSSATPLTTTSARFLSSISGSSVNPEIVTATIFGN